MTAYRAASVPGDARAPEIEIFRMASSTRGLFAAALGSFLSGAVTGALALARHDPTFASLALMGVVGAAVLALLGRRGSKLLVVSHLPAERTLHIVLDARAKSDEMHAFRERPTVRLDEVHQMRSNPEASDAAPVFRVRVDGAPRGVAIDHLFTKDAAERLRRALSEAIALWPEP